MRARNKFFDCKISSIPEFGIEAAFEGNTISKLNALILLSNFRINFRF